MNAPPLGNLVPYLFYDDIEAMIEWYARVFGFVEKERWRGADGKVHNAEMYVGDTELWMDGATVRHLTDADGNQVSTWVGVWLSDRAEVDAMYEHVTSEGVSPNEAPQDLPYGVRSFSVSDPEGHAWGFMCHIPRTGSTASE